MSKSGKIFSLLAFGALSLLFMSCSSAADKTTDNPLSASSPSTTPANVPDDTGPPPDVVQASADELELRAGSTADATIKLKIANGYHINGNPASKFQIATALDVSPGAGITAVKTIYPPSITKKFSFADEPITVYEGEAVIKQTLRAEAGAQKGTQNLRGKLKVQPCDDHVCYPPRTLEVSLPVNVK